jgi:hypothetical protein
MMITFLWIIRTAMMTTSMMISVVVFVMAQADCKCILREAGSQRHQGESGEQLDEVHFERAEKDGEVDERRIDLFIMAWWWS